MEQRRTRSARVTDRDRLLLEFIAEHRLVLCAHVEALLGASAGAASRRLRALEQAGLLHRERLFHRYPAHYRVTRNGLGLIGSRLPVPRRDVSVGHDVGLAWVCLAAHRGAFGPLREVVSERRMRSLDGAEAYAARVTGHTEHEPFGVRPFGHGAGGYARLHYPDLLLVDRDGRRIAVELELSSKGRRRRHEIIGGYASDRRVDAVLYLVQDPRIAREVQSAARRFGSQRRVLVQQTCMVPGQVPETGTAAPRRADRGPADRGPAAPPAARGPADRGSLNRGSYSRTSARPPELAG